MRRLEGTTSVNVEALRRRRREPTWVVMTYEPCKNVNVTCFNVILQASEIAVNLLILAILNRNCPTSGCYILNYAVTSKSYKLWVTDKAVSPNILVGKRISVVKPIYTIISNLWCKNCSCRVVTANSSWYSFEVNIRFIRTTHFGWYSRNFGK